ncbi:hypothetical protein M9458_014915, partial [Cirrhinus mrigala]
SGVSESADEHLTLLAVFTAVLQLSQRVSELLAQSGEGIVSTLQLGAVYLQIPLQRYNLSP